MNTSINFRAFTDIIQTRIQEKLGEDYKVYTKEVKKNNGIELTGLIAQKKNCNTSPAIYINEFYKEDITREEVLEIADSLYEDYEMPEFGQTLDLSGFIDFSKAQKQVAFKLIHAEQNRELLEEIPHRLFFNLAIVYYYTVKEAPFHGKASILVHNSHMKQWNTTEEELFQSAMRNTPTLLPWKLENMEEVMTELLSDGLCSDISDLKNDSQPFPMYVLSNQPKLLGAACILYPGVLQECAKELEGNFYVLPSSIHEGATRFAA